MNDDLAMCVTLGEGASIAFAVPEILEGFLDARRARVVASGVDAARQESDEGRQSR